MNSLKYILGGLVVAGFGLLIGYFVFPSAQFAASLPAGTNNSDAKFYTQNFSVASDTVYSVLNTDSTDRLITGFEFYGTGGTATTSQYSLNCGTSTVASGIAVSTSYIVNQNLSQTGFATTTGAATPLYIASSSPGLTGTSSITSLSTGLLGTSAIVRVWPTNTYLTCKLVDNTSGANALNTFDSLTKGYIGFQARTQ